jgi:disulfide bond formation protein DsbB
MTRTHAIILNAIALYGVALVLTVAFAAQILLHELPCLLQRILFASPQLQAFR